MSEYAWMCIFKQNSEYALGPKYAKILNMAKFWICQNMPWQSSEYVLGSKYARILNMTGFGICKSYTGFEICKHNMAEYAWIGREYAWICLKNRALNMDHRSLYKLMSFWEIGVFRTQPKI